MTTPADLPDDSVGDVAPAVADLDTIVSLAKRRGFVFPSSEIYGGINAVWDYGPLGVELKNNVKRAWWRAMVQERDDIVGLDAGILMHPQVWVTSGHVGSFSDPLVECQTGQRRFRVDELPGAEDLSPRRSCSTRASSSASGCAARCDGGPLSAPRQFNLMFKTFVGPVEEEAAIVYLRPETAQGIYVNFKNVLQSTRKKLPFGIAQIGKAFRNEISPGNFVFRMREFEQMEMQYFVRPDDAATRLRGVAAARAAPGTSATASTRRGCGLREHRPGRAGALREEGRRRRVPLPVRLEGARGHPQPRRLRPVAPRRGQSGENLEYFDQATERALHPVGRRDVGRRPTGRRSRSSSTPTGRRRSAARPACRWRSTPSSRRTRSRCCRCSRSGPEIVELCHRIKADLQRHMMAVYDDTAAIGKLYRRQDEIGTPWCVTVDVDSLEDGAVTVRDRDSMAQERVPVEGVTRLILDRLAAARAG